MYWVIFGLLCAAFVGLLVGAFTTSAAVSVPSGGMAPTIPAGSKVIYQRGGAGGVVRGDIVLVRIPGGLLLRRVIGLPGDHVTCCAAGGRVSLDGKVLDEDYVSSGPSMPDSVVPFNVVVPSGRIWVMGDNRGDAADSREWGTLPMSDVLGRAVLISGGGKATVVRTPAVFTQDGLAPADHRIPLVFLLLGGAVIALVAVGLQGAVGLIVWLVRRSRRARISRPQPMAW